MHGMTFHFDNTIIVISLLFSAIYMIVLGTYIWIKGGHGGRVVHWFVCGQFLLMLWATFHIFELIAPPSISHRWVVVCVEYIGICYLGQAFYLFARAYGGRKKLKRKSLLMITAIPTFIYLTVVTNPPLHYQFYKSFGMNSEVYGPFCWASLVMTLTFLTLGVYEFTRKVEIKSVYRKKTNDLFCRRILYSNDNSYHDGHWLTRLWL